MSDDCEIIIGQNVEFSQSVVLTATEVTGLY